MVSFFIYCHCYLVDNQSFFPLFSNEIIHLSGMTIVFTTKHPEELCYAYKAGLMRDGHVYIEDRPEELLRNYHCHTYIQMYNKFCMSNIPRRLRPSIAYYEQTNNDGQGFSGNLTIPPPSQLSYQTTQSQSLGEADNSSHNSNNFHDINHQQQQEQHFDGSGSDITATVANSVDNNKDKNTIHSYDGDDSNYSGDSMDVEDLQRTSLPLPMAQWPIAERRRTAYISHLFNFDFKRLYSLVLKNYFVIIGNIHLIILFYFIFPAMQIILVCFLSSRPFTSINNLPVTIVIAQSHDVNNPRIERLIRYTIDRSIFKPEIIVGDINESIKRIRRGETLAVIVPWLIEQTVIDFKNSSQNNDRTRDENSGGNNYNHDNDDEEEEDNFTYCQKLIYNWRMGFNSTMFGLRLHLDGSNFFINYLINFTLADSMQQLLTNDERMHELMPFDCPQIYHSMKQNHIPISLDIPNFLSRSSPPTNIKNLRLRFIEFILPGTILAIVFAYALVLTSYLFIKEQMAGLQERCLTAGASGIEILISHMISQSVLFFLQELLLIFLMKNMFGIPQRSIRWYGPGSLIWMLGFMGIVAGLFVGVICPRPRSAAFFISGMSRFR